MNRFVASCVLVLCIAAPAAAQTEGRVSVGASVTYAQPTDDDVNPVTLFGPLVRLNPRRGWGPAGALNWFRADLDNPSGSSDSFATLRVRPLMGGIAYTIGPDHVLTSFSIVGGPSFNKIDFEEDFLRRIVGSGVVPPEVDIENSIAIRPGISVTWTIAPRVAIVGFGGYVFNRPDVVYRDEFGREFRSEWRADATVLSVGAVYSLF